MKDILITSSALILTLLVLRRVFRGTVSRRLQYALWGLVLARLLIPSGLFRTPVADFSVLTATAPVRQAVTQRLDSQVFYSRPIGQMTPEALAQRDIRLSDVPTAEEGSAFILTELTTISAFPPQQQGYLVRDAETNTVTLYEHMAVGPWELLGAIWKAGMAVMALFFLASNLLFYRKLRKARREYTPEGWNGRRVYLIPDGAIPSPCLFGRSIYLTPAALETPEKLRHVLAHEETHARHLDPLWSLLRCVCLTVYWFDPLVWIAAECSKTDCELACDESVLKALGEDERIGYGETLLSLIPVKKGPANPMLAATTMTAGKKQLKDRITRIAQRPRQIAAAALAVALLVAIAAACTFTGGADGEAQTGPSPAPSESVRPDDSALRSLTAGELRWFNEQFFNSAAGEKTGRDPYVYFGGNGGVEYYNIRNQFASPINLYDKPEDIDLHSLFYLEGSPPSDEELKAIGYGSWDDLPCPAYKLTTAEIDGILKANTGLTLEQTNKVNLTYRYDDHTDAYYWMHGDTNYPGELSFTQGTREGATVKLYHNSDFAGSSWYCVTLSEQGDGVYWFRSNQTCDQPAIPVALPAGEPALTISLDGLEPYTTHAVALESRPESDFPGGYKNRLDNWSFDDHHVMAYVGTDGLLRCALVRSDGGFDVFLTMDKDQYGDMFFFKGLFGRDGFYVDHTAGAGNFPQRNYYYFTADGVLTLLLEATTYNRGGAFQLDLDGDGSDELAADNSLFFLRDGEVYQADLPALLAKADPALKYCAWVQWDVYSRSATATGPKADNSNFSWTRHIYFNGGSLQGYTGRQWMSPQLDAMASLSLPDGGSLLVYTDEKATVDHMAAGADANAPAAVVAEAKAYVESQLEPLPDGTWVNAESAVYHAAENRSDVIFDDWRVESFDGPYREQVGDTLVETWAFNYELHTQTPEKVVLAGGRYLTEDGWVSPGYPGCDWLIFRVEGDTYTFLWHEVSNDMSPGSYYWTQHLETRLAEFGVELSGPSAAAAAQIQEDLDYFMGLETICYNYQTGDGESHFAFGSPDDGNARNRQLWFTQPDTYRWSYALTMPDYQAGDYAKTPSLTISDSTWERYLRFWPDSNYVMSVKPGEGGRFYKVENLTDPEDVFYENSQIFNFMRLIYDEAEFTTLREDALAAEPRLKAGFMDDFKLYDWAKAWATQYELANAQVDPESCFAFSWQKVIEVEVADQTDTSMSIWYTLAFTPANEIAYRSCWAGNTDEFKNFPYPDPEWNVPDGALYYSRVLRLEKQNGAWTIVGAGTG